MFIKESLVIAELYLQLGDWRLTRDYIHLHNVLQQRTQASTQRITVEIIRRLKCLTQDELNYLVTANPQERGYLLWVAVCQDYEFIHDFARDLVRDYFLLFRYQMCYQDFDLFFNGKMLWHEELSNITASTRDRLRLNLFKMLKESGLLSADHWIQPVLLTPSLASLLSGRGRSVFEIFPIADIDINRWLTT